MNKDYSPRFEDVSALAIVLVSVVSTPTIKLKNEVIQLYNQTYMSPSWSFTHMIYELEATTITVSIAVDKFNLVFQ